MSDQILTFNKKYNCNTQALQLTNEQTFNPFTWIHNKINKINAKLVNLSPFVAYKCIMLWFSLRIFHIFTTVLKTNKSNVIVPYVFVYYAELCAYVRKEIGKRKTFVHLFAIIFMNKKKHTKFFEEDKLKMLSPILITRRVYNYCALWHKENLYKVSAKRVFTTNGRSFSLNAKN